MFFDGQHFIAGSYREAGENLRGRHGNKIGPRPPAAGIQGQVLSQEAVLAELRRLIEVEAVGECVAIEQGIETGPVECGQNVAQQTAVELGLEKRLVRGRIFTVPPRRRSPSASPIFSGSTRCSAAVAAAGGRRHVDAGGRRRWRLRLRGGRQLVAAIDERAVDVDGEEAIAGHE